MKVLTRRLRTRAIEVALIEEMHARTEELQRDSSRKALPEGPYFLGMGESLTLTAVFTPDENGWTMAQLAEWPAVVTCAPTLDEARDMLVDAAREMVASYREEDREPPIGGGRVESLKISLAA